MLVNDHIIKNLYNAYGGSGRKKTVILDDNHQYLLKFPKLMRDKDNQLYYSSNTISEHIACQIFRSIGIPVQDRTQFLVSTLIRMVRRI